MNIDWKRPDRDRATGEEQTLDMILLDVIQAGIAETKAEALRYVRRKVPEEGYYQKKIMDYLKKWAKERSLPCVCWKATQGMYSRGGVSDVICLIDGVMLAVEVKRPLFGEVSELQKQFIKEVNDALGLATVAVYPEDLQLMLEKLLFRLQSRNGEWG